MDFEGDKKAEEDVDRKSERSTTSGKKQQRAAPTAEPASPRGQLGVGGVQPGVGGSSSRSTGVSGGQLGVGRGTGAREGLTEVSGTSLLRSPGPASPTDPERSSSRKPGVSQHSSVTAAAATTIMIMIIIIRPLLISESF